ncbi:MAG: hypothetical protein ABIJ65_14980, partial [Chloroflexota bacterium]
KTQILADTQYLLQNQNTDAIVTHLPGPPGVSSDIDLALDSTNDQNIYISNLDFVFHSTNGGDSWTETLIGNYVALKDIEICASNPSRLYISGRDFFGWSNDAGVTWTKQQKDGILIYTACDPSDENIIYTVDFNGNLYKSIDGGQTWESIGDEFNASRISSLLIDQQDSEILYVGTDVGLYRTVDRGQTWLKIPTHFGNKVDSLAGYFDSAHKIIYEEADMGIFKSTNDGTSWSFIHERTDSYPTEEIRPTIIIDPFNFNVIYLIKWYEGIFKSTNGGITWQTWNNGTSILTRRLVASNQNLNLLYFAAWGSNSIMKSLDGGETWGEITSGLARQRVDSVSVGEYLYAGSGGSGIYYSKDQGQTWALGKGMEGGATEIQEIEFNPEDIQEMYAVDFDRQAWKSVDSGENWQLILKTDAYTRDIAISTSEPNTIFVAATNDGIYRSEDGGKTWVRLTKGIEGKFIAVVSVDPKDKNIILCVTATNPTGNAVIDKTYRIYKSINKGDTWYQVYQVDVDVQYPNMVDLAFDPVHPGTVYATFFGSPGVVSMDNGQNWIEHNEFDEGGEDLLVIPLDSSHIWSARIVDGRSVIINALGQELIINDDQIRSIVHIANDPTNPGILYVADMVRGVYKVDVRGFLNCISTCPTNIKASDGTYTNKVQITWTGASAAKSYKIYRSDGRNGTKTLLGRSTILTFNDTKTIPGVTYYYYVTGCKGKTCSAYSTSNTGWRKLSPPGNVQATDGIYANRVRVSWRASSGATTYKVYQARSASGKKTLLGNTNALFFND